MTFAPALAMAAALVAGGCRQEPRTVTVQISDEAMMARLRSDFRGRVDLPSADDTPIRGSDRAWRSPSGTPITLIGVLSWTRPAQNEGVPLTAYSCASEYRYWVHQGVGLGNTEFWFGPFAFRR